MGLKPNDSRNAYVQIADDLRRQILAGDLAPGDRLPSTSDLVTKYEVANMTIQGAFRLLREENLIYSVQGRGTFVRSDFDPSDAAPDQPSDEYLALGAQIEGLGEAVALLADRLDKVEKNQARRAKR